jgi:cytochrome c oxidase subunit 2
MKRNLLIALAIIAIFAVGVSSSTADNNAPGAGQERVIKIVAQRFMYTPNEITLKKGEPVTLEFRSLDFIHGFKVPDLGIRADLPPARNTLVHLTPEKTGRFPFLCDNFCGSGHEDMSGVIIVTE